MWPHDFIWLTLVISVISMKQYLLPQEIFFKSHYILFNVKVLIFHWSVSQGNSYSKVAFPQEYSQHWTIHGVHSSMKVWVECGVFLKLKIFSTATIFYVNITVAGTIWEKIMKKVNFLVGDNLRRHEKTGAGTGIESESPSPWTVSAPEQLSTPWWGLLEVDLKLIWYWPCNTEVHSHTHTHPEIQGSQANNVSHLSVFPHPTQVSHTGEQCPVLQREKAGETAQGGLDFVWGDHLPTYSRHLSSPFTLPFPSFSC